MVEFTSGSLLYATFILAIVLFFVSLYRIRRMDKKGQVLIGLSIVIGFLLFYVQQVQITTLLLLEVGMLNFNGLLSDKSPRIRAAYVVICAVYVIMIHYIGFMFIAQAMLLGILSVITKLKEYRNRIENKRVEVSRDVFHMVAGTFLMLMFYFETEPIAVTFQMLMILGGILAICITETFKDNRFSNFIFRFERNGAALGYGALWLALGSLFAVSFLSKLYVLAVFSAIFLGDPVATIVGVHFGGAKLPWNHKKSIIGSAVYFAVTAGISMLFIPLPYAVLIGLAGAFVESLKIKIDDNLSVSAVLTVLLLALGA